MTQPGVPDSADWQRACRHGCITGLLAGTDEVHYTLSLS